MLFLSVALYGLREKQAKTLRKKAKRKGKKILRQKTKNKKVRVFKKNGVFAIFLQQQKQK